MKATIAMGMLLLAGAAQAAMVSKNVEYDVGGKKMQSVLVYDDAVKTPRPGLVMTPDWLGINDDNIALAKQTAGKDYVILVADVYGSSVTYHGKVVGFSAGTGSAFSLLPAQNATGNWIKVVQRLPVRIQLDPQELARHPLRVGLSMKAKIDLSSKP